MVVDKNTEMIEMLAKNEQEVAGLYRAFSERFPDYKDFWSNLAAEELKHASQLRTLVSTGGGNIHIKQGRFNIIAIKNFSKHILEEASPIKVKNSILINALSIALSIEQSLIEQKYFEVFDSDSDELKQVLSSIAADTKKHLENVRQLWAKQGTS